MFAYEQVAGATTLVLFPGWSYGSGSPESIGAQSRHSGMHCSLHDAREDHCLVLLYSWIPPIKPSSSSGHPLCKIQALPLPLSKKKLENLRLKRMFQSDSHLYGNLLLKQLPCLSVRSCLVTVQLTIAELAPPMLPVEWFYTGL